MTLISFPPWRPDRHAFNDEVAGEAKGVLVGGNSYIPWPQLNAVTSAMAGAIRGAFLARATDGTRKLFVGTATKLYRVDSATVFTDVTRVSGGDYALPADERWSMDQFGTDLVAANGADAIQVIDIDSGTAFDALGGSPPVAGLVRTIGTQLFLGRIASFPQRVQWSGRGDHEFWTVGQRDADRQDFQDGGQVTGLTKIETGFVFQRGAIRRITPVTTRAIYGFSRIEEKRGLVAPSSLVDYGASAFYYSEEGFFQSDLSGASIPIGKDDVDAWFAANANMARLATIVGVCDPANDHVFWLFPTSGVTSYVLNHIICYDIRRKMWTHADISASSIFGGATLGYNIDNFDAFLTSIGLTMDTAGSILLDAQWIQAGASTFAAIDSSHKLAFFTGSPMAAVLETAEFQPIIGKRSFVRGITPIADNASAQVQVGKKESIAGSLTYNNAQTVNARGFVSPRVSGRVHRVRWSATAGDMWTHARGVDVDAIEDGEI